MPKPENLLMSYIVCDMLSKSDQTVAHDAWVRIIEDMSERFKAAGATRQTVSQIWNREGTFKLGFMWNTKTKKHSYSVKVYFVRPRWNFKNELA